MQQTEVAIKRTGKEQKKKVGSELIILCLELVDKEVLYLTGGLYPAQIQPINNQKPSYVSWVNENMILKNPLVTNIKHWVPKENQNQLFSGEKFNIPSEKIEFTQEEYNNCVNNYYYSNAKQNIEHTNWNYEETVYLFEQMNLFDNKFIVVTDRYNFNGKAREIYEIKDRYFKMLTTLLKLKDKTTHPLFNYKYDPYYEQKRHYELEKYIRRTKTINDDEKRIMEDLKKIDLMIKKQEKEHTNLRRTLKIDNSTNVFSLFFQIIQEDLEEDQFNYIVKVHKEAQDQIEQVSESFTFMRNKWINETLPVPPKVQKKLEGHIRECLSQNAQTNQKIFITESTQDLYDQLRQLLLTYLSLQRLEKRREQVKQILLISKDKRLLDEQVRRLKSKIENQTTNQSQPSVVNPQNAQERQPPLDIDKYSVIKKQKTVK